MENNYLVKKIKTKRNDKCGDCFYNGNCMISIKKCVYIKQNQKNKKNQL